MVAMPIRNPVNDPGPQATANTSTSDSVAAHSPSRVKMSAGSRSAYVRDGSPQSSWATHSSSTSATLPASVVVSSASTRITLKYMSASVTPAMRQYLDAKQQHRDAILFFRMGDFYEIFFEAALVAARALELTLTARSKDANGSGIPMCGVPFHAVDTYIARLVKKGFRVAICDQVEDPRKARGIVKREIVRVVSPGSLTDVNYLDAREPAFLMAVLPPAGRATDESRGE